jgi:hypothetical protein
MPEAKTNTITHDDGGGAVVLAEIPAVLPREVAPLRTWEDRARLSAHITRIMFTVSSRTLETWPIRWIMVNKRALGNTEEALAHARWMMDQAEKQAVRGGCATSEGAPAMAAPESEIGAEARIDARDNGTDSDLRTINPHIGKGHPRKHPIEVNGCVGTQPV